MELQIEKNSILRFYPIDTHINLTYYFVLARECNLKVGDKVYCWVLSLS